MSFSVCVVDVRIVESRERNEAVASRRLIASLGMKDPRPMAIGLDRPSSARLLGWPRIGKGVKGAGKLDF